MANENRRITEVERAGLIWCLKKLHDLDFTLGDYEHSIVGRAALFLEESVDAVEVVRCKDCKHYLEREQGCNHFGYYSHTPYVEEDDFCSYGERRADGN